MSIVLPDDARFTRLEKVGAFVVAVYANTPLGLSEYRVGQTDLCNWIADRQRRGLPIGAQKMVLETLKAVN